MSDAFIVELIMQVEVVQPASVAQAAIKSFVDVEFEGDPDGGRRARMEQTMRDRIDQALQTLIRPTKIAENIPGVSFGGGQVLVRHREPDERLPWEPSMNDN